MNSLLQIFFLLSTSVYVGSMIFFSFFTTLTLFRELQREMAGDIVGKLFPQYYLLGYITLASALVSLALRGLLERPFPLVRVIFLALMLGSTLYAGLSLQPKIHQLKTVVRVMEEGPAQDMKKAEFGALHRVSVILNLVVLALGLAVLAISAVKMRP